MSRVAQILAAESPASEMRPRAEVRAVPGQGLEGDRYFSGTGTFSPPRQNPDFEITFIELEKVEAFARESNLPFTPMHARRNIVTEGVSLNDLAGKEFYVGEVRIRGIRLCSAPSPLNRERENSNSVSLLSPSCAATLGA